MNPEPQGHPDDVFTPGEKLECPPVTQNVTTVSALTPPIGLVQTEQENNAVG